MGNKFVFYRKIEKSKYCRYGYELIRRNIMHSSKEFYTHMHNSLFKISLNVKSCAANHCIPDLFCKKS